MYDFHKKTSSDGKQHIFYHPLFQKGSEQLLARIRRKKNTKRSSKGSLSTDSTMTSKQRRAKFLEEVGQGYKKYKMTKSYVVMLENHIKTLVSEYSFLLDQCKQMALDLNNVK
jgi:hypothetical protein